jgi:putative Mn2+ efflux pump MntP
VNNFTLLLILTGVSSDALTTGCLLGAVDSNSQELKKLVVIIVLLMLQVVLFYAGWKFGFFLLGHLKSKAGLMGALVLMALGIKMTAERRFKSPKAKVLNSHHVGLLMTGTAVYVFAAGNALGLSQTNGHLPLLLLPALLLLFLIAGGILTNNRRYLNWVHRVGSLLVVAGAAILLVQNF